MQRLLKLIKCRALLTSLMLTAFPAGSMADRQLSLGEQGLGVIGVSTPFDLSVLRDEMPNVVWQQANQQTEDGERPVIRAAQNGETDFALIGDGDGLIAAIEITNRRIGNHLGPRVGDDFLNSDQTAHLGDCWLGTAAQAGRILCEAAQSQRITYVFAGRWSGPDDQMPPRSVLNTWTLSQIVWRPDRLTSTGKPRAETGPAFDCSKARGPVEEMICRSHELAPLDRRLNAVYAKFFAATSSAEQDQLRAEQRGWVAARNDCWKSVNPHRCVIDTYTDRIAELSTKTTVLPGTAWRGVRIAGDMIPPNIDINLTFGHDGKATGFSGCNRFFASYDLDINTLNFYGTGGTRRICPEIEMLAERRFLDALEKVNGWTKSGDDLVLFGAGAELTLHHM